LTIPLCVSSDREEIASAWRIWSDISRFAIDGRRASRTRHAAPAPQRDPGAASEIPGAAAQRRFAEPANIHQDEREIIARD